MSPVQPYGKDLNVYIIEMWIPIDIRIKEKTVTQPEGSLKTVGKQSPIAIIVT